MNRRAKQAIIWQTRECGADVVDWEEAAKHTIVSIRRPDGSILNLALARNQPDETMLKRLIRRSIARSA